MKFSRGRYLFLILGLMWILSGCQTTKKIGKVILDPDTPVGEANDQPSTIQMILLADPDTNPNIQGEAAPVAISVVYLSEDSKMLAADYDQLAGDLLDKTLGKNYIDHQDYMLLPDQFKPLPVIKLEEKNSYIGVVAYYSDDNRSEWKKIIKIKGIGHNYHVLIHLRSNEVDLKEEEE